MIKILNFSESKIIQEVNKLKGIDKKINGKISNMSKFVMSFVITAFILNSFLSSAKAFTERQEIIFIENNVTDFQTLVDAVKPGMEVHVLDSSKDGLEQMSQILKGRSGAD